MIETPNIAYDPPQSQEQSQELLTSFSQFLWTKLGARKMLPTCPPMELTFAKVGRQVGRQN
jgi:hypothetical protein